MNTSKKIRAIALIVSSFVFAFTFVLGLAVGCASPQQTIKTTKDVVRLAEEACVVIREDAPDSKAGQEVCAKEDELRPFIKLILGGRARAGADAGDGGQH